MEQEEKEMDIIWTLDKVCGWNCSFCCVDAYSVRSKGKNISIQSNSLSLTIPNSSNESPYMQAAEVLREKGLALTLREKLQILDNLKGMKLQLGFSGGDFLLVRDNLQVIKKASELFGKQNIGITTTGVGMQIGGIRDYLDYVGQVEFTYDNIDDQDINHNQIGYNRSNLEAFAKYCKGRVTTQALIPISNSNCKPEIINILYSKLASAGVDKIYLMRTFPVGRGMLNQPAISLSADAYRTAITEYRRLEATDQGPKVNIMCALKNLFPDNKENPCTFLKSSVDITASGDLVTDAFAYNQFGEMLHPDFVLGNLKENGLFDLYYQERVRKLVSRADENFGHCKIFAYLASNKGIEGLFNKNDPLYNGSKI